MLPMRRICILMGLLVGAYLIASSAVSFATPADFATTDPIAPIYASEGGTEGWLGASVSPMLPPEHMDKNRETEHWRQDFERGYIAWSKVNQRYEAMPYFVQIEGDPRIYLVHYGQRRWIPDDTTWQEFCHWRGIESSRRLVKVLSDPATYPLGKSVDHLMRLGTVKVYYVPRGTHATRLVGSPWAMSNWGLLWGDIIALSPEEMAKYRTDGPGFHPGHGGEARPSIEVLSFPKWATGDGENVVWTIRQGRDVVVRWELQGWFTDTDTELHYRVDGGMPQKTATQHGGNKRYQATIPGELLVGAKQIDMWIRAAEQGKSSSSDDSRLEFWEPDVSAGFAPLAITVRGE